MHDPLDELTESLLRGGLSPSRVHRYTRELSEHRQDIAEHLQSEGMDPGAALREAQRRLGNLESLSLPMLIDARFRSRAHRLPAMFYVALPLFMQVVAWSACLITFIAAATLWRDATMEYASLVPLLWLAAPVLIGWTMLALAAHRRTRAHWPVIGVAAGSVAAVVIRPTITPPLADLPGELSLAMASPALLPLVVLLLVALLPLSILRFERPAQ